MSRTTWIRALLSVGLASSLILTGCGEEMTGGDGGSDGSGPHMDSGGGDIDGSSGGCGDGVRDRDTEVCDDGNTEDGDGCSSDCQSDETCGNGITDRAVGEVCDDGNTDDGDTCRGDCLSDYQCGNGVVDTTASGGPVDEACDDGNTMNGDGCSAGCDSDESCGNGTVDLAVGEVCDDGNTEGGDDCSADCMTSLLCGNGALDGAEECDDGNTDDGDGCNASCRIERCGNGRVDAGEDCDDGDTDDTNGCTTDCTYTCSADADCDDGDLCNGDEVCTDAGTDASQCSAGTPLSDGDSCGSGSICNGGSCVAEACGDGLVSGAEECDDMNTTDGDGCDNDCTFTCSGDSDCSDSNPCNGDETCSDAGTASSACVAGTPLADGDSCGGANICRGGTCTAPGCGDGVVTGSEDCDDGNSTDGDGCDNDCTWTCAGDGDCDDGNPCNGTESCTSPSSLSSMCTGGTPPGDGTACGGGDICSGGSCVAPRCGDGIVTSPEDCDDGNTTSGDGCDGDCSWTCAGDGDCDNGAVCDGSETCSDPGTLSSQCVAGTPPATGTLCDRDTDPGTRDICNMTTATCVASVCGDGYTDTGASPPEECDDGNTTAGDGCSPTCEMEAAVPPTGFRIRTMRLISPRIVAQIPLGGCQDITDDCPRVFGGCVEDGVNTLLQTALNPTSMGGDFDLHIVELFSPLNPAAATSPTELHLNPMCTEGMPHSCGPDPTMPDTVSGTATNLSSGTCYTPDPAEVDARAGDPATYGPPTANTVGGPCYSANIPSITVEISGISIPLTDATIAATYSGGSPPATLVSGTITGFLSEEDAVAVMLPSDLPVVGGDPLYEHLQAGNRTVMGTVDGCNLGGGTHEDDADMNGTTRGFRFFLNFTAEVVDWTP
jgi:cysteine-rich repeat protein